MCSVTAATIATAIITAAGTAYSVHAQEKAQSEAEEKARQQAAQAEKQLQAAQDAAQKQADAMAEAMGSIEMPEIKIPEQITYESPKSAQNAVTAARTKQAQRARLAMGKKSTIKTGSLGLGDFAAGTKKKTLGGAV